MLKQDFSLMKKTGVKRKAVIFTQSVEPRKILQRLMSPCYTTLSYHGSADYSVIRRFQEEGEVLLSTDNGAKGFHLADTVFAIHYDLLYNTPKMEPTHRQRPRWSEIFKPPWTPTRIVTDRRSPPLMMYRLPLSP